MSATKRKQPSAYEVRQARIEQLAAQLDNDDAELVQRCRTAAAGFDAGIMAADPTAVDEASVQFAAAIICMNGGRREGCKSSDDSPGKRVASLLASKPGTVPSWGQSGRFEIDAEGMRAVVDYSPPLTDFSFHLQFHAVDEGRPFISSTGYKSHFFQTAAGGCTVQAFAAALLRAFKRERVEIIEATYRDRVRSNSGLPWLASIENKGPVMNDRGQLGFAF